MVMSRVVITFGTFDVFHIGHLKILRRAKKEGARLVVGVSSDALNFKKKKRYPVYSQDERIAIVSALACVDHVFLEESLELKAQYILQHNASLLVMGDDWQGRFDDMPCAVKYLPRTPSVSTTQIIETIKTI
jgi:glycerol-3-phosphate cytidylyltransferase